MSRSKAWTIFFVKTHN